jgi:alkanesulfonate monooxygenase SsuD/methylene tetrahydromethanopterin reductase-like flavin-dependent oxidoreductase (luciferase family)
MEVGIDSFASVGTSENGETADATQSVAELLERIEQADRSGLDIFGIGEHHRHEFLDSANAVILAAAAARTERIRLTSAVTVLSAADPVRVFQQFATLDLISKGRAEMVVGRGSFTEAFPLFGFSLGDYDEIFAEKLELLLKIRDNETVNWSGKFRPALENRVRCKSRFPSGSGSAVHRNPSSAPECLDCHSWSPLSAAKRTAFARSSIYTAMPESAPDTRPKH